MKKIKFITKITRSFTDRYHPISEKASNNMEVAQTNEKYEHCVMCGRITSTLKDAHIDFRENYEIGFGQMCHTCYQIHTTPKPSCSNVEMQQLIESLRK